MEHIVQFALGIDDEAIKANVEKNAEQSIISDIGKDVRKELFKGDRWNSSITSFAEVCIEKYLDSIKGEIIDAAAERLADKLSRTKAGREAVAKASEVAGV